MHKVKKLNITSNLSNLEDTTWIFHWLHILTQTMFSDNDDVYALSNIFQPQHVILCNLDPSWVKPIFFFIKKENKVGLTYSSFRMRRRDSSREKPLKPSRKPLITYKNQLELSQLGEGKKGTATTRQNLLIMSQQLLDHKIEV